MRSTSPTLGYVNSRGAGEGEDREEDLDGDAGEVVGAGHLAVLAAAELAAGDLVELAPVLAAGEAGAVDGDRVGRSAEEGTAHTGIQAIVQASDDPSVSEEREPPHLEPGPDPGPMAVPRDEVHLWWADLDSAGWPGASGLPAAERDRADRLLAAGARRRWIASRWALRQVLGRYLGRDPAKVPLARQEGGKPRLESGAERVEFNLSHSGPVAVVAVGGAGAIGVDVERIRAGRRVVRLADRILPAEEAAEVRAAHGDARTRIFYERWTRHEAVVKCLGRGLDDPRGDAPVAVRSLSLAPGYASAVAVAGEEMPPLRCWWLEESAGAAYGSTGYAAALWARSISSSQQPEMVKPKPSGD
jgi:4'-phosphopantetheinyl transferase